MAGYTTYADRQQIVTLHSQGWSYQQIVERTGWSYECVRQICRRYKRQEQAALQPQPLGQPSRGPLSSFDGLVRFAVLKIKRQHPGWGAEVVLAELRKRSWALGLS